jgi:hypothetical protein
MSTDETMITRAEHDAAIVAARSDATALAQASPLATTEKAVADATVAATASAITAERERIKAITALDESKGRESASLHVALNTGMSVDEAKGFLAGLPTTASSARAGGNAFGLVVDVGPTGSNAKSDHGWGDVAAELNKSLAR